MDLETDITIIKIVAEKKEEENEAFRYYLKNRDSGKIDVRVHRINRSIAPRIDCTLCGNCCRSLMINVTVTDIERLAMQLEKSTQEIQDRYLEEGTEKGCIVKQIPCFFLDDKKCTVYENRFESCREFPHLHKPGFTSRLFSIMMSYSMCPIVFNVVESLKDELGFKR